MHRAIAQWAEPQSDELRDGMPTTRGPARNHRHLVRTPLARFSRGIAQLVERRSDLAGGRVVRVPLPRLTWRQKLGRPECPYAERWIFDAKLFSLRLHHFFRSDDARAHHDHPWWFLTLVLAGSYVDDSPAGQDRLTPGSIRFRSAHHRHTVVTSGVWTVLLTGPQQRVWGFWERRKDGTLRFRKSWRWFFDQGHHPCDQP